MKEMLGLFGLRGVVRVWSWHPDGGRYGFIEPYETGAPGRIFYFDERSLDCKPDTIAEGDSVEFVVDPAGEGRQQVSRLSRVGRQDARATVHSEVVMATVVTSVPTQGFGSLRLADGRSTILWFRDIPDPKYVPEVGSRVRCRVLDGPTGSEVYDVWEASTDVEQARTVRGPKPASPRGHLDGPGPAQSTISLPGPQVSPLPRSTSSNSSTAQGAKPTSDQGPFKYDISVCKLLLSNGIALDIPARYATVLSALMAKGGGRWGLVSSLKYEKIALLFEEGKLRECKSGQKNRAREEEIAARRPDIERQAVKIAHEFRRQFGRWLCGKRIDPKAVIKCSKKTQRYCLGTGWDPRHPVIHGSEPGVFVGGRGDAMDSGTDAAEPDGEE